MFTAEPNGAMEWKQQTSLTAELLKQPHEVVLISRSLGFAAICVLLLLLLHRAL